MDTPITQQIKKNINAILALEGEEQFFLSDVCYTRTKLGSIVSVTIAKQFR
jgi:shikimate kinase